MLLQKITVRARSIEETIRAVKWIFVRHNTVIMLYILVNKCYFDKGERRPSLTLLSSVNRASLPSSFEEVVAGWVGVLGAIRIPHAGAEESVWPCVLPLQMEPSTATGLATTAWGTDLLDRPTRTCSPGCRRSRFKIGRSGGAGSAERKCPTRGITLTRTGANGFSVRSVPTATTESTPWKRTSGPRTRCPPPPLLYTIIFSSSCSTTDSSTSYPLRPHHRTTPVLISRLSNCPSKHIMHSYHASRPFFGTLKAYSTLFWALRCV